MSRHSDDYLLANLQELEKSEKREDYRMVLKYAIEAVAYLPSTMQQNIIGEEKLLKIVGYIGDYLAVLRERDELLNLQIAFNLYSGQEKLLQKINKQLSDSVNHLDIAQNVVNYLETVPGASLEEITDQINAEKSLVNILLNRAVQLGVISKKNNNFVLKDKDLELKELLHM